MSENNIQKALQEIADKVLEYNKTFGDNPAANHCRNIALEALAKSKSTPSTLSPEIGDKVLRWIKGADRKPPENMEKQISIRFENGGRDGARFFGNQFHIWAGNSFGWMPTVTSASKIEWLEEIDATAAQPTETPTTGEVPAIPKMSDELAAMADVAAIEYGKDNGQRVCREEDDYDNSPDLTDAFLAGQSWMYHKMQDVITMVTETSEGMAQRNAELGEEIDRLKASLEESRNDAKVFQEWYRRGDENIIVVTEEAADYRKLLDELFPNLSLQEKEAVAPVLDKYTKK